MDGTSTVHLKPDTHTNNLIASNRLMIEAAQELIAKADRERERLRVAIEESRKLREQWRNRFRTQAERHGGWE